MGQAPTSLTLGASGLPWMTRQGANSKGNAMPMKIGWGVSVSVPAGPQMQVSRSIEVQAYDSVMVDVPMSTTDMSVEIQPGGAGKVKFLAIFASRYEDLSFKVNSSAS